MKRYGGVDSTAEPTQGPSTTPHFLVCRLHTHLRLGALRRIAAAAAAVAAATAAAAEAGCLLLPYHSTIIAVAVGPSLRAPHLARPGPAWDAAIPIPCNFPTKYSVLRTCSRTMSRTSPLPCTTLLPYSSYLLAPGSLLPPPSPSPSPSSFPFPFSSSPPSRVIARHVSAWQTSSLDRR